MTSRTEYGWRFVQHLAKAFDGVGYHVTRRGAEAEGEPSEVGADGAIRRDRMKEHAPLVGRASDSAIVEPRAADDREVEGAGNGSHTEPVGERREQAREKFRAALILAGHAAHVARETAFGDELCEDVLRVRVGAERRCGAGGAERRREMRRCDNEADAQAGRESLAERADVDHAAVGVGALQRGQ